VGLVDHLEQHLGELNGEGFFRSEHSPEQKLAVVSFPDQPCDGATTLASLGLSHHRLDGDGPRQEFLISCWQHWTFESASILTGVVKEALRRHEVLEWGATFNVRKPICDGSTAHGFLAWEPFLFDDEFGIVHVQDGTHVALTWLIPLTPDEIRFARAHSSARLIDILWETDVDVLDLARRSVELPEENQGRRPFTPAPG
jgi:Suppressor of fused protein (SUFU)